MSASSGSRNSSSTFWTMVRKRRQLALAGGGEADEVAATIGDVAPPLDQLLLLECVEDADQHAAVELKRIRDGCLRLARAFVEERQDAVVVGAEADLLELLEGAGLESHAQPRQQESRALDELARKARVRRDDAIDGRCLHIATDEE